MQRKQRFVADQRYDLPHHESMMALIDAEFYAYNKNFFSPLNRVAKGWKIVNNGGLQVKIDQGSDSLLFNTQRSGHETLILRKTTDVALTLNLADNATNYVEVQIISGTCAPDTVALWDTTANGGAGEEYTQTVDTQAEERPVLVSNTIGFTGDSDKLPLAIVVTAGGVINSITDAKNYLFHVDADWDFGVVRTDKTIGNAKEAFDALATKIKETNGTSNWYDKSWASGKLLKEYQNLFFYDGGNIEWEGSQGSNKLGWDAAIKIEIADRPSVYQIDAQQVTMLEGDAMYVDIPEGVPSGSLTPIVMPLSSVPIDPASSGYSASIQVLFFRRNNKIIGMMDIPDLESGEVGSIGLELSSNQLSRLGLIGDTSYIAYSSTTNILASDNYPTAIGKLDAAIYAIQTDTAKEEHFISSIGGQSLFIAGVLQWSALNSIPDIAVYVNGVKMKQAPDGNPLSGDFIKTTINRIQFSYTIPAGHTVTIRDERSGGSGGGGSVDLTNIAVDIQPDVNANHSIGTVSKAWKDMYLKDKVTSQVYRLQISNGILEIVPVP